MKNTQREIIIVGGSDQAKAALDICIDLDLRVFGFFDISCTPGEFINDLQVFNSTSQFTPISNFNYILAIGHNYTRLKASNELRRKLDETHFPSIIHPSAAVSSSTEIDSGITIMRNASIDHAAELGFGTIINSGSIVSHDVKISSFSSLGPGAKIAGHTSIGRNSHIGIGATIIEQCKIGDNVVIGAGATVINNVPDNSLAVGTPAKVIRKINYKDNFYKK